MKNEEKRNEYFFAKNLKILRIVCGRPEARGGVGGRVGGRVGGGSGAGAGGYDFTHLVFLYFSNLTDNNCYFQLENRIPGAKLCMLAAGMV